LLIAVAAPGGDHASTALELLGPVRGRASRRNPGRSASPWPVPGARAGRGSGT